MRRQIVGPAVLEVEAAPALKSEGPGPSSDCPIASKKALRPAAASSGVRSGTGPV